MARKSIPSKWTIENLKIEALKYKTRTEFYNNNKWAYTQALKSGLMGKICAHMPRRVDQSGENAGRFKWTREKIQEEALKYKTRNEFKENSGAYCAALRLGILDEVCRHMISRLRDWTYEELMLEALKYDSRLKFQKGSKNAYNCAHRRGILDEICVHMNRPDRVIVFPKWTLEALKEEALKYTYRVDFWRYSKSAYSSAVNRKVMGQICSHMLKYYATSSQEQSLFDSITETYPSTKKLKKRNIFITEKPLIRGFDCDIYVPELSKGIEFDGKYWHSFEGLKRSRKGWPDEDIRNYHQIKDEYFASIGIDILHIEERDWLEDKEKCIKLCLEFLQS
jgi:hypothetical protein